MPVFKIRFYSGCLKRTIRAASPGAAESERILAGEGCAMFERSEFAPAAKIRVDEGSLA